MALVNPNIAMGVRPFELNYQPRNALTDYAQVIQIQNAQREQATRNALNEGYQAAYDPVTQTVDQNKLMTFMANKGYGSQIPGIQKGILEARTAQVGYDKAQQDLAAARMKEARNLLPNVTTPEAYAQWREYAAKQMPGIAAMLPQQYSPDGVQRLMVEADKWLELNKPTTQVINRSGQTDIVRVPGAYDTTGAPTTLGTYGDVPLPAAVQAQKVQQSAASRPSITVSTEKKYGEQFAGLIAKEDADLRSAAMKAPEAAATADRIIDLVDTGKVITGTGANTRLQIAKALNLAGATDSERIANTEMLISAQARITMAAIKSSNLGAGQGFTNADRDFLEKAEAGQISYDAKSIRQLGELSRRAAEASAEKWNKRVKEIPADALAGTGISTEGIVVPKRGKPAAKSSMAIPESLKSRPDFKELEALWPYMDEAGRKSFMEK